MWAVSQSCLRDEVTIQTEQMLRHIVLIGDLPCILLDINPERVQCSEDKRQLHVQNPLRMFYASHPLFDADLYPFPVINNYEYNSFNYTPLNSGSPSSELESGGYIWKP